MPFNRRAVIELRERRKWSQIYFNVEFSKFLINQNYEKGKKSYSLQGIIDWEDGASNPKIAELDSLYRFAESLGYTDLDFYARPK